MTRHRLEFAAFREFRNTWLTNNSSGACITPLARTDTLGDTAAYLSGHPLELPRYSTNFAMKTGNAPQFGEPSGSSYYLCLLIEDLEDSGQLLLTRSPSRLLLDFEDEVVHSGYLAELEEKRLGSIRYLETPPIEWLRRLAPVTEESVRLILSEPKLYHSQGAASRVSFMGGLFRWEALVPLGIWATLWKQGKAIFPCASCGGNVHVFHASRGLSMGSRGGSCDRCGSYESQNSTESVLEVRKLLETLPVRKGRPYRIDEAVEMVTREA